MCVYAVDVSLCFSLVSRVSVSISVTASLCFLVHVVASLPVSVSVFVSVRARLSLFDSASLLLAGYPLLMTYTPLPLLTLSPILALAGGDVEAELFLFRCCLLFLYLIGPLCW